MAEHKFNAKVDEKIRKKAKELSEPLPGITRTTPTGSLGGRDDKKSKKSEESK